MKIIDTNHILSNAEVLTWAKNKRKQHAQEDAEDRAHGGHSHTRPSNFTSVLDKTERHLTSDTYPYEKNPSAYADAAAQTQSLKNFHNATLAKIQAPLIAKYKHAIRVESLPVKKAKAQLEAEQERKELTELELMAVFNHAPTSVDMLQPMLEDGENRFTSEELEVLVNVVKEVLRPDQLRRGEVVLEGEGGGEGGDGVDGDPIAEA